MAEGTYSGGEYRRWSGFYGVNSEAFQETRFQNKNESAYYVILSGVSNLPEVTFSGNISTNGSASLGSIDFDMAKNLFWICTADNTWHRVMTDHDKK